RGQRAPSARWRRGEQSQLFAGLSAPGRKVVACQRRELVVSVETLEVLSLTSLGARQLLPDPRRNGIVRARRHQPERCLEKQRQDILCCRMWYEDPVEVLRRGFSLGCRAELARDLRHPVDTQKVGHTLEGQIQRCHQVWHDVGALIETQHLEQTSERSSLSSRRDALTHELGHKSGLDPARYPLEAELAAEDVAVKES